MKPKKMQLRLFFVVFAAVLSYSPAWATQALAAPHGVLRVLTYNVWGLPRPLLVKPARLPILQQTAAAIDADVITFQETFARDTEVLAQIAGFPHVARGPAKSRRKISSGLMIVSRWPILQTATMKYDDCQADDCFSNKGALYARIDVPGIGEVDFFTTHMDAGGKDKVRLNQVRQLRAFIDGHTGDRPVVVTGDFNVRSDSEVYYEMRRYGGFRDAHEEYRASHTDLSLVEWHGFTADSDRNGNLKFAQPFHNPGRIDYVWLKEKGCTRMEVDRTQLAFDEPVDGYFLSDHFGVKAEIYVDAGSGCL